MKITANTLKRGIRTFFQTAISSIIVGGSAIVWTDVDVKSTLIGLTLTSIFSGLNALLMNLEKK